MKIEVKQTDKYPTLLEYESDIIPMVGDTYAGMQFKDGYQRKIIGRLLFPTCPNNILVYVDYSFPSLVKTENQLTDYEAEIADLETQEHLS